METTTLEKPTLRVVMGNAKLGRQIPNVNLPAIQTCRKDAPCKKGCYACHGNFLYESVARAHQRNLAAYRDDPKAFFKVITDFLLNGMTTYKFFRWHSSGDIVDAAYLEGMVKVAKKCPKTQFLAFTKKFELVNYYLSTGKTFPRNLHVVFSAWDKDFHFDNPYNLPVTYVDFKHKEMNSPDIPEDAFVCPGSCEQCQRCWKMKSGDAVVFHQH